MRGVRPELWRWAGELYADGLGRPEVARELERAGLSPELAAEVAHDVGVIAALSLPNQLRRELGPDRLVECTTAPSSSAFWREHWELNRPLVLRGYADAWPARRWTLTNLVERFGDAPIEVEVDRDPTHHFEGRWVTMCLRDFVADLETRPGNDRYCIARNKNLEKALTSLLDDVVVDPELFDASRLHGGSSLWIGPAGTTTPLHYDTTHILFTQLVGRKRFGLVSPDWSGLYLRLDGFYVREDLAAVPPGALYEVTLAAGDALFLPAGWLHRVEALDTSVSLSLLCFRRPNDFSWCHPAKLLQSSSR
jgi:hypothetical protein